MLPRTTQKPAKCFGDSLFPRHPHHGHRHLGRSKARGPKSHMGWKQGAPKRPKCHKGTTAVVQPHPLVLGFWEVRNFRGLILGSAGQKPEMEQGFDLSTGLTSTMVENSSNFEG